MTHVLSMAIVAIVTIAHVLPGSVLRQPQSAGPAVPQQGAQTPPPAQADAPLNLNTATQQQLEKLPGIGPAVAQRIVEHRQKNGPFKKVEELMNVQGIGEKTFLRLKPLVTVAPPKTEPR